MLTNHSNAAGFLIIIKNAIATFLAINKAKALFLKNFIKTTRNLQQYYISYQNLNQLSFQLSLL